MEEHAVVWVVEEVLPVGGGGDVVAFVRGAEVGEDVGAGYEEGDWDG